MAQITLELDDDLMAQVQAATAAAGVSQNEWIAEAVRSRVRSEWPAPVLALAGAWPDFPTAEEIRGSLARDVVREEL